MSSHQANTNKPQALKCQCFCFSFDLRNYCPTCREAGKRDNPCVTNAKLCKLEKGNISLRLNMLLHPTLRRNLRLLCKSKRPRASSEQGHSKSNPDPVLYREEDMSDLPSQYTENIETFRQIFKLPDPRDSMPRSPTTVWSRRPTGA